MPTLTVTTPADRLREMAADADKGLLFSKFEGDDLRRIARHVDEMEAKAKAQPKGAPDA